MAALCRPDNEIAIPLEETEGVKDTDYKVRPLPLCATDAEPGSQEKILIMRDRVKQGEQPNHPLDRQFKRMEGDT